MKLIFTICLLTLLLPITVLADDLYPAPADDTTSPPAPAATAPAGQAPANSQTAAKAEPVTLTNPLGTTDVLVINNRVVKISLGFLGGAAFLMFLWGGMQWLVSRGDTKLITSGKNTIIWAILGLILIFTSYIILQFVFKALGYAQ